MPTKTQTKHRHNRHIRKNYGKEYLKTYLPYLPVLLILLVVLVGGRASNWQPLRPQTGVKAYATSMSSAGLLDATNQHRASYSRAGLTLNSQLAQAAQAKANDMAARNYWSHNTPEGNPPWVFIEQAGYSYSKAGENLAYGFSTSSSTVSGWMNSPSHKDNMLDSDFLEVGFGYANNENYQDSGPQTIVVAMYGRPTGAPVAAASSPTAAPPPATAPAPAPTPAPAPSPSPAPAPAPTPAPAPPSSTPTSVPVKTESPAPTQEAPVNSDNQSQAEPASKTIARAQTLWSGQLAWAGYATGLLTGVLVAAWVLKHWLAIRHLLRTGRHFALHHPIFDIVVVSLLIVTSFLSNTAGIIK